MSGHANKPEAVSLLWCPECGRTDRFMPLNEGPHYTHNGSLCKGLPERLTYLLAVPAVSS